MSYKTFLTRMISSPQGRVKRKADTKHWTAEAKKRPVAVSEIPIRGGLLLLCLLMMACRTQANLSTEHHTNSQCQTQTEHRTTHTANRDTVHVFDSVRIHERSDTVYIEHLRTEWRERIIEKADTILLTDTVRIELYDSIVQLPSHRGDGRGLREDTTHRPQWLRWLAGINIVVALFFLLRFFWNRQIRSFTM